MPTTRLRIAASLLCLVVVLGLDTHAVGAGGPLALRAAAPHAASPARPTPTPPRPPVTFEANVGQLPSAIRFIARSADYTTLLADDGLTVVARATGASDQARSALRWRFQDARDGLAPVGSRRAATLSHYYLGNDPAAWHTHVPHFTEVTYAQAFAGIDVVFKGNGSNVRFDFEVAPGADPSLVALAFDDADSVTGEIDGSLSIRRAGTVVRQLAPLAFQLAADGTQVPVDVRYVVGVDRTVRLALGDYDSTRALTIDPTLVYSTYFGGDGLEFPGLDAGASIAVDAAGAAYIAGDTDSTTLYGVGPAASQSTTNVFVTKLDAAGAAVAFTVFLGGSLIDDHATVALDPIGGLYVTARTSSTNLPVTAATFQSTYGGGASDAFVAKLSASTGALQYLTYLGGSDSESPEGLSVSGAGNAVVTGRTNSSNFPTISAFQSAKASPGANDAFVTKLLTDGTGAVFSTYLGGNASDVAFSVVIDSLDTVYVGGRTASSDFPTSIGAFDSSLAGAEDIFVTRLAATGASLLFSTYLGGTEDTSGGTTGNESARIAVDSGGNVYVAGFTNAADFPAGSASPVPQAVKSTGYDAVLAKLNSTGTTLLYRTFLGGTAADVATAIALDQYGNLYVTGITASADFPTAGTAWDTTLGGASDAYVAKIKADGTSLRYSSFLGGGANDGGLALTVDNPGNVYVTGYAGSADFPAVSAFDATRGGALDAFVTKVRFQDDNNNGTPDDQEAGGGGGGGSGDSDGDGLPDDWENDNGLDPNSGSGNNGADGDPDNDGSPNSEEFQNGTDPNSAVVRYFAEGATSTFFDTQFALANTSATLNATVVMQFRTAAGQVISASLTIPPLRRTTVTPKTLTNPTTGNSLGLENAEFSTEVRSNITVLSDRTMAWSANGYGSHAETSVAAPSATWYLAEGATIGGFNLFYLIQNPNNANITVRVRYLLPNGAGPVIDYAVDANSRKTIWVNQEPGLESAEISAVVTTDASTPIIVERAMYLDAGGEFWGAGHSSAAVAAPALNWFLAEGATGPFFDLFVLVANPNATDATIEARFLKEDGTNEVRTYTVSANSRFNIWVDLLAGLENTAVSTTITSTNGVPVIVERAMWWSSGPGSWYEGHNSAGVTQTGTRWGLAEGEVGNTGDKDTYILIANTSSFVGAARVTLLFEDGTTAQKDYTMLPNSRLNAYIRGDFPAAAGKRFGAIVESLGGTPAQIVVERAMYSVASNAPGGQVWSAGTNSLAFRLQ